MTGLVLGGLAAVVGYLGWIYFHPFRPCPRCKGKGTNRGSTKRRHGPCRKCGGTRHVQALGSRMLHRAVRGAATYRRDRKDK
ncbi:MAG TPA: hypothetical protein VIJ82_21960 [Streptosporangiaceae bacterium]|jgi:DnaJ-class molecular chaperone